MELSRRSIALAILFLLIALGLIGRIYDDLVRRERVEEVKIPYLVKHIEEYEGRKVRLTRTVRYYVSVYMFEDFRLEEHGAKIPIKLGEELKEKIRKLPENSTIIVEGIVTWCELEGGFYYGLAERLRFL